MAQVRPWSSKWAGGPGIAASMALAAAAKPWWGAWSCRPRLRGTRLSASLRRGPFPGRILAGKVGRQFWRLLGGARWVRGVRGFPGARRAPVQGNECPEGAAGCACGGGGGAGPWKRRPALEGGGREGRPAVLVWFLVVGRAGAPVWVYPRGLWWRVWLRLAWCGRCALRLGHSWAVHSMISRAAGWAMSVFVSPLTYSPM